MSAGSEVVCMAMINARFTPYMIQIPFQTEKCFNFTVLVSIISARVNTGSKQRYIHSWLLFGCYTTVHPILSEIELLLFLLASKVTWAEYEIHGCKPAVNSILNHNILFWGYKQTPWNSSSVHVNIDASGLEAAQTCEIWK